MSDTVAAHFDAVANNYDQILPFFRTFADQTLSKINLPQTGRVLDVGAGRGALTARLVGDRRHVSAVDAAPTMIELLKRSFPTVDAQVMDAAHLEFDGDTFELAVSGFVMHLLPDPLAALAEIKRVLKPLAVAAVTVPGRAPGETDPWIDPLGELFAEYRSYQPHGSGRLSPGIDVGQAFIDAGFVGPTATSIEIALPVEDGETYWSFTRSHGAGTFINGLPPQRQQEFHDRLVALVDGSGGVMLRRSATLWSGHKAALP